MKVTYYTPSNFNNYRDNSRLKSNLEKIDNGRADKISNQSNAANKTLPTSIPPKKSWAEIAENEPQVQNLEKGFNWLGAIEGRTPQDAIKQEMGIEKYKQYQKTLDNSSKGLQSLKSWEETI